MKVISKINDWQAQILCWLSFACIVLMTFESLARYVFNAPTIWGYDVVVMTGAVMYFFAFAYVHKLNEHIRVDVLYSRLSERGKAILDVACAILLFFPLIGALTYGAFYMVIDSWVTHEISTESAWFPIMWPIRTICAIGLVLLLLQGIVQFIDDLRKAMRRSQ
jgi:TRAP-type mannitol/chloroaromatic compound transport system permease small subunit